MLCTRSAHATTLAVHEQDNLIAQLKEENFRLAAELQAVTVELSKVRTAAAQERGVCIEMCRQVDHAQAKIKSDEDKIRADRRELASLMKELDRSIAAQQQRDSELRALKIELAKERAQLADERKERARDQEFEQELAKLNDSLEARVLELLKRVRELEDSQARQEAIALLPPIQPQAEPKAVFSSNRRKSIGLTAGSKLAVDQLEALAELENLMTPSRPARTIATKPQAQAQAHVPIPASSSRLRQPVATPRRAERQK
jgi:hypothetical protein